MEKETLAARARSPARQGGAELLERETELDQLSTTFQRAREGRGTVVAFDGPSGIGKSQLLAAGGEMARQSGLQVLSAAGREIESDYRFGVVLQLLEARVASAEADERDRLFAGPARLALPLLAQSSGDDLPDEGDSFSLLHGLYWLCANLSWDQPLALIIDDVQHVDRASLRFALYLAQRLDELPVALVLAGELRSAGRSAEHIEELLAYPVARTMRLKPLSPEAVATKLRGSLFPNASDRFCLACFGATGGNPFLLRELSVALTRDGEDGDGDAARVLEAGPESLGRSVLLRLQGLGTGAAQLAKAVAVLGYGAELRHAARIAGLEPAHAARIAEQVMGAEVFARAELLSFVHPIVQRAVEAATPAAERAAAHLSAARVLAEDGAPLERVATHLLQSSARGTEWVAEVLAAAAAASMSSGAPEAAIRYLRRGLEEPPSASRRPELLLRLGQAEALLAAPEAVPRLREARELADVPSERAAAELGLGRMLCAQGRYLDAAEALRRGLDVLDGADADLGAQLQAGLASAELLALSPDRVRRPAPPQLHTSSALPDTAAARVAFAEQALTRALEGRHVDEVRALAERALEGGALLGLETADGLGYYLATTALILCEDYQAAERALAAAIQDARRRGSALGFAMASCFRAVTFLGRGRLDRAEAEAENALATVPRAHGIVFPTVQAVLAAVLLERGQLDEAERRLGRSSLPEGSGILELTRLAGEGQLRRQRGDLTGAVEAFERCGAGLAAAKIRNPAVLGWRSGAALALVELGDSARAARLVEEELELARAFGAPGAIGAALHATALVETNGRREQALRTALGVLEGSQKPLARARVLVDLGATLRRAGTPKAAREPLRQGLDLAERCGAKLLALRATEEVAAAGSRPRRTALSGTGALTTRERQMAELAASGMSNREIAKSLYVTVKTVEWHLRHTFRKLGVSSRHELAPVLKTETERRPSRTPRSR